eukprot:s4109_g3.t1
MMLQLQLCFCLKIMKRVHPSIQQVGTTHRETDSVQLNQLLKACGVVCAHTAHFASGDFDTSHPKQHWRLDWRQEGIGLPLLQTAGKPVLHSAGIETCNTLETLC